MKKEDNVGINIILKTLGNCQISSMELTFNALVNSFPKQYNNILVKTLTNRKNLFSLEEQKFRLINEEL